MEISLININISDKRVTLFPEMFLCLLFLKNNQPEIEQADPVPPCIQPAFCLWKNFSQRKKLIREGTK